MFVHLKVANSFSIIFSVLLPINTYPPWQMAAPPLWMSQYCVLLWQNYVYICLISRKLPHTLLQFAALQLLSCWYTVQDKSSAGRRASTSSRRLPAQDYAFIAYWGVPSPPPGTNQALVEEGFWRDTFGLGGGRFRCSPEPPLPPLFPSRPSRTHVHVGLPATGSGPTRPAGHAVAGRKPSYASRIRVERAGLPRRNLPLRSSLKFVIATRRIFKCKKEEFLRIEN